jgi:hypothetical protein
MDKKIEFAILNAIHTKKGLTFFYNQGYKPLHFAMFLKELKLSGLVISDINGLSLSELGFKTLNSLKKEFSHTSHNNLPILPAFGEKIEKINENDIYLPNSDDVNLLG